MSARGAGIGAGRCRAGAAALVIALAAGASPAAADKADSLFAKGKAQLAKKQYAEACPTFEKVDELDPGIGAKLNVAKCYQEWGKLVRAHKWYVAAEKKATESRDKRAPKIRALIKEIEPDIPRLTIRVPEGADLAAAAIEIDGEPLTASALDGEARVEPGPHVITYRVDGKEQSKTIAIERGGAREVTLELPSAEKAEATPTPSSKKKKKKAGGRSSPGPSRGFRIASFTLMAGGAVSLGAASYLALDARSSYQSALAMHCMGAKDMCSDEGLRLTGDARSRANLGTLFAIVGAAAIASGVAVYVTAPRSGPAERRRAEDDEALYLAPAFGDRAGFVVFGGRY
jgi:tetratricopeptide (TPR) repeat protein